tara:strand:- start:1069 stop:2574 length:1506 start_codon:yes stop_codon:yes gene_type:complete
MKSNIIFKSKLKFFLFLFLGFLLSFSLPPYNYIFLGFIIFPFILYLLKLNEQENPNVFFVFGLLFSFGYFVSSLYWISYSLNFDPEVAILKPFAILILPLILSVFYGLGFYIFKRFFKFEFFFVLNFSILMALTEHIRSYITGFSWNLFVYALSEQLASIQILNIIGTFSLNLFIIFIFSFPYFLLKKNKISFIKRLILLIFLIGINYLYGLNRLQTNLETKNQQIIFVQPNESLLKINSNSQNYIKKIINMAKPLDKKDNAIFLWPEGSYSFLNNDNLNDIFKTNFKMNQKIILGANTKDKNGNIFNSFVILDSNGKIIDVYNKIHLVPFGEFIPFENFIKFLNLKKVTFGYQSFSRGVDRNILKINESLVLPLICYEVIDTGMININKNNFDVIFNISEDGWFDRSIGTYQHFVHSIFRSIEEGKHIFRSTNQGVSASINPLGVIIKSSKPNKKTVFVENYQILNNNTPFSVLGNLMFLFIIFLSFLIQLFFKRYFKLS